MTQNLIEWMWKIKIPLDNGSNGFVCVDELVMRFVAFAIRAQTCRQLCVFLIQSFCQHEKCVIRTSRLYNSISANINHRQQESTYRFYCFLCIHKPRNGSRCLYGNVWNDCDEHNLCAMVYTMRFGLFLKAYFKTLCMRFPIRASMKTHEQQQFDMVNRIVTHFLSVRCM